MPALASLFPPETLPAWFAKALQYDGLREIPGIKNDPKLMAVLDMADGVQDGKTVGANNDDEAYCAKGHSAIYEMCDIKSTRSAWARSYLSWGQKLNGPALGCTCVLSRGKDFGHVMWPLGRDAAGNLLGFGFNQGDAVKVSPFEVTRVLGYRWPAGFPLPAVTGFFNLPLLALNAGVVSRDEA